MANKTKIFLSSVGQSSLDAIRQDLFTGLKEMGHDPLRFEDNFGPWGRDAIERCLQKVEESDIYLLIVSDKMGTYLEHEQRTVTHLEFEKAFQTDKQVLVFVEEQVKSKFFSLLRSPMETRIFEWEQTHRNEPDFYLDIVKNVIDQDLLPKEKDSITYIDDYIWAFLYDIMYKGYYLESISLARSPLDTIKEYLSEMLKMGSQYLAIEKDIITNAKASDELWGLKQITFDFIDLLKDGEITNWRKFLATLKYHMVGHPIIKHEGTYMQYEIGSYGNCKALTLYRKENDQLKLIEGEGLFDHKNNSYDLTDKTSYVVETYNNEGKNLFYREDKQLLYYTVKANDFVLCFHYPLDSSWNKEKVKQLHDEVFGAIMNRQDEQYRDFAIKLLGGLKHDKES
ncbi:DUF4062 domain-containing protein [Alkalihalobacillus deserti]|uniref:DUF4062 domain-containing protein n=1 Tax=Alkalihalobacillus deserti TaxID=2879466 RepID=UPI001D152E6F|nr:DUF4062 domain-containing protein [Alkalihalobacillus deserti]